MSFFESWLKIVSGFEREEKEKEEREKRKRRRDYWGGFGNGSEC